MKPWNGVDKRPIILIFSSLQEEEEEEGLWNKEEERNSSSFDSVFQVCLVDWLRD